MPVRVVLVDDSAIVRGMCQRALKADPEIDVVATASDGQMALDVLKKTPADVVVLDIEMPIMDGMVALPEIVRLYPNIRVVMSSTLTHRNAEISLKALSLGASDYLSKPSASSENLDAFFRDLTSKVKALGPRKAYAAVASPTAAPASAPAPVKLAKASTMPPQALAIACSTGGPQALLQIFEALKGRRFRVPVFITQHMPPSFTSILASHISKTFGGDCHEAISGEEAKSGIIYLAPGDFHMTAEKAGGQVKLHLDQNAPENFCRPAADPMFRALSKIYGPALLAVVLTGLGSDGAKGSVEVARNGGTVVSQNEASSVVYGMPKAVAETGVVSTVLPLADVAAHLMRVGIV